MSVKDHKKNKYRLKISVITVSSTRNEENDESGKILINEIKKSHILCDYTIVKDDKIQILKSLFSMLEKCDAVILNGGTGISGKDVTYEAVKPVLDKELPGFGEIFRVMSYEEIGTAAMMSRATAGVCCNKLIFLIPGSPNGVKKGAEIIFSEVEHMWYETHKETI